jgi:[ribosomal protein S18]-alanine N-acetyltransferase
VPYLQFKPLTEADLPAVLQLDKECFGGLWTLAGYQRELASDRSHFLLLSCSNVAASLPTPSNAIGNLESNISAAKSGLNLFASKVSDTEIDNCLIGIGCFWSILEEAHITLIAIHPNYQHQGLGRLLLYGLLQKAWEEGLERATLEVRVSNESAISLYKKFGFQTAGTRPRYYPDNREDALILWRKGLQYPDFPQLLNTWKTEISALISQKDWRLPQK